MWREYQALKGLTPENVLVVNREECRQTFRWINEIDFDGVTFNAFECLEETAEGTTPFVWLTGFHIDAGNVVELSQRGGRQRWKIENEGFNAQKNGGYGGEFTAGAHSGDHGQPGGVLAKDVGGVDGDRDRCGKVALDSRHAHTDPV